MRLPLPILCCLAALVTGFILGQARSVSLAATQQRYQVLYATEIFHNSIEQCLNPSHADGWAMGGMCRGVLARSLNNQLDPHRGFGRLVSIYHAAGNDVFIFLK
ncbi:MAG TPA: hypothetical protein VFP86_02195 [bacterium]|nr:hypothetical protein [bacterium]